MSFVGGDQQNASLDTQFATEYGTTRLPVGTTIGAVLVHYQAVQVIARASSTDALWLGILTQDESTAAELNDPYNEPHATWMWRAQVPTQSAAGSVVSPVLSMGGPVRIKAQRRIDTLGIRPWLVGFAFGTTDWDVHYDVSLLLLLP